MPFRRLPSHALVDKDWLDLVRTIHKIFDEDKADGVVITHGTNTIEETAYFLNLTLKTDKPVVVVGSMRPSSAISADGYLNLVNAIKVAADPSSKGRGCLAGDERHDLQRPRRDQERDVSGRSFSVARPRPARLRRRRRQDRLLPPAGAQAHDGYRVRREKSAVAAAGRHGAFLRRRRRHDDRSGGQRRRQRYRQRGNRRRPADAGRRRGVR